MTRETDPLRPQKPGGMGRGAMIAVAVHVVLIAALAFGVSWRASEPEGMTAELWSATPQAAAPRAVEPPPAPPPPPPEPPKPKVEEPPKPDPQIAIEQEKKEREARERSEREKVEREKAERDRQERERERERLEKERVEKERVEKERLEKERREEAARDKRLAQLNEKARKEQMERMQGMIGATGAPDSTGTAQRSSGPSAGYQGKLRAAIYPNITLLDSVLGNPEALVEVRTSPDGAILSRRLVKSSGNRIWDEAVLNAIDRTRTLPKDVDGRVPTPIEILFRPREQ
jgi:colicin import membrane protein